MLLLNVALIQTIFPQLHLKKHSSLFEYYTFYLHKFEGL